MARVTVEDCIDKVESPYELVLVAKERAAQLGSGIEPTIDRDNDKNTVISLREIAGEKIKVNDLTESAIYKLRKHVEQVDDGNEDDEIVGDDFTSAIDQYRRGLGKFSGGRPVQALIGACYRFLTTWRTIKKLRTYREQNLNDSVDPQISAEAEGGDQARRAANSASDGQLGPRFIQGSSNPQQGSNPDD